MTIYVGNLSFQAEQEDLLDLFSQYGEVAKCSLPLDRETGRKRGFAFVEMASDADEQKAIDDLQNVEWMGRMIRVNKATPREGGGGGGGGGRGGYGGGGRRRRQPLVIGGAGSPRRPNPHPGRLPESTPQPSRKPLGGGQWSAHPGALRVGPGLTLSWPLRGFQAPAGP